MPRRELLTPAQRQQVLALPSDARQIAECYALSAADLDLVSIHRGEPNRLGFAVQLCFLRHPGRAWSPEEQLPSPMVSFIAHQVETEPEHLTDYARRDETRREHLGELLGTLGWSTFGLADYRELSAWLVGLARTTDHGLVLVQALISELRRRRVVVPVLAVLERLATAVRSRARRETYRALTADLSAEQRILLDALLEPRPDTAQTHLGWMRQPAGVPSAGNILKCIERLTSLRSVGIPASWANRVHQNRLLQIAREGANTDAAHLRELTEDRRYATLVATVLDTVATLTDETLEMHERFTGRQFRKAERRHQEAFQQSGKAINEKLNLYARIGHALIAARASASDPYGAIEALLPWARFCASVDEAARLAKPDDFDYLGLVGDGYAQLRRYAPEFLAAFEFRAAPAGEELLRAVELLCELNANNTRKVPDGAPRGFIRRRWETLVFAGDGIERRFYEWCVMAEL